jgi:signal recognition particle receptor subunit beta
MNNNTNINGGIHKFDDTVLFWGGMNSGNTALLHRLLFDHHRDANDENKNNKLDEKNGTNWELPMTVSSMVANAIYLDATDSKNNNKEAVVRIIDYPGHPSLSSQFIPLLSPSSLSSTHRLIFTIDTTQPIVDSVNRLYHSILIHPAVRSSYSRDNNGLDVLITCTKTDLKGSKNYKRIKIQMRNEMERLRKVDEALGSKSTNDDNEKEWRLEGKNIDLDNLGKDVPIRLYFVEVSLADVDCPGLKVVRDFVLFGVVPDGAKK